MKVLLIVMLLITSVGATGENYTATGYCLTGKMANGKRTRRGVVAADPRKHPLGSILRISNAGRYSGSYLVADTGGAIKGNRIDVWMGCSEAKVFGRRKITVSKG